MSEKEEILEELNTAIRKETDSGAHAILMALKYIIEKQGKETIEGDIIPLNMVKARIFVKHIENHLRAGEMVCCKICGKTIDHIFEEEGVVKS